MITAGWSPGDSQCVLYYHGAHQRMGTGARGSVSRQPLTSAVTFLTYSSSGVWDLDPSHEAKEWPFVLHVCHPVRAM